MALSGIEGNLIRLSPETLQRLYSSELYKQVKEETQAKHIVLCPDCIKRALGVEMLTLSDLDFKNGKWYTINLQYLAKKMQIDPIKVAHSPECKGCITSVKPSQTRKYLNSLK